MMKYDSDSRQILDSEQTKWLRKCIMLLWLLGWLIAAAFEAKCKNNKSWQCSAYYSYSACFSHYYSA